MLDCYRDVPMCARVRGCVRVSVCVCVCVCVCLCVRALAHMQHHAQVLPFTSCLINCMYWDARFPRLITNDQMAQLTMERRSRLIGISDISCDVQGGVEFLTHSTTIEKPFFM